MLDCPRRVEARVPRLDCPDRHPCRGPNTQPFRGARSPEVGQRQAVIVDVAHEATFTAERQRFVDRTQKLAAAERVLPVRLAREASQ